MDAAQSIFEELKRKDLFLLDQWVEDSYREDLHLDFKQKSRPHEPDMDENDKRIFSKALSGFANSDGGVVVWGIDAPGSGTSKREKRPITKVLGFAEQLDSMASRLVVPPVEGVVNYVIFEDKPAGLGYVTTYIPKSIASPHRAEHHSYKRYFQRRGDSFVHLEHWQLEYMFGRRQVPDLKISWHVVPLDKFDGINVYTEGIFRMEKGKSDLQKAILRIFVSNKGRAIAKYTCLRLHFKEQHKFYHFNQKYRHNLINYSRPVNTYFKPGYLEITARARPGLVVYPSDRLCFYEFTLSYNHDEIRRQSLPDCTFYYDLFAEHIRGITEQKLTISGEVIARILQGKGNES